MKNSEWVDLQELARILKCKTETLRRGCVSGRYTCRFSKSGKFKNYEILLSSLPARYLKAFNDFNSPKAKEINIESSEYSDAPEWARKQADKYLELLGLTKGYTRSKIENFLVLWNNEHPERLFVIPLIIKPRLNMNNLVLQVFYLKKVRVIIVAKSMKITLNITRVYT